MDTNRYRTAQKRIWATIVDFIVFMPLLLVLRYLFNETTNNNLITFWTILTGLAPIIYTILLHFKYGQTIGKWAADVKVLDVSEKRQLNLKQCFLRNIVDLVLAVWTLINQLSPEGSTQESGFGMLGSINVPTNLLFGWLVAKFITLLVSEKRRAVQDMLARSVVIRIS